VSIASGRDLNPGKAAKRSEATSTRPAVCWLSPAAQLFGRDPTGVNHKLRPQDRKGDTVSATVLHMSEVCELWEALHGA
jgi:hypothetical protein